MKPIRRLVLGLALPFVVAGCAVDSPAPRGSGSDAFILVADIQEVMLHILEPAADAYWDAVGWIIDFEGEHAFRPETEEEWEEVLNAAYAIAESGNLLMMDGRTVEGPWIPLAQVMVETGRRAIEAARSEDPDAVFDLGAEIYYSCTGCHAVYAIETLRPSARTD